MVSWSLEGKVMTAGAGDMAWTAGGHALGSPEMQTESRLRGPMPAPTLGLCSRHPSASVPSAPGHTSSHNPPST